MITNHGPNGRTLRPLLKLLYPATEVGNLGSEVGNVVGGAASPGRLRTNVPRPRRLEHAGVLQLSDALWTVSSATLYVPASALSDGIFSPSANSPARMRRTRSS